MASPGYPPDWKRLLLERIELTKRRDAADEVKRWRHATFEERFEAMMELSNLGDTMPGTHVGEPDPLPLHPLPRK